LRLHGRELRRYADPDAKKAAFERMLPVRDASRHSPRCGEFQFETVSVKRMMVNHYHLANRCSNNTLAAARDWLEPSAESPGLIRSTGTARRCQPEALSKCISCPLPDPSCGRSQCAQGQRAFLPLPWLCGALTSPWQPLSTVQSPEGSLRALPPNLLRLAAPECLYLPLVALPGLSLIVPI